MKSKLTIQLESGSYADVEVIYEYTNDDYKDNPRLLEIPEVKIDAYNIISITSDDEDVNRQIKEYYSEIENEIKHKL